MFLDSDDQVKWIMKWMRLLINLQSVVKRVGEMKHVSLGMAYVGLKGGVGSLGFVLIHPMKTMADIEVNLMMMNEDQVEPLF